MTKQCPPKPPAPREMTAAELDAAFARIRKAIDAIVQREREKDEKEKAANATR